MVDDGVADHENPEFFKSIDLGADFGSRGALSESGAVFPNLFGNLAEVTIEKLRGAEDHRADVTNLSAVCGDLREIVADVACDIVRSVFVFRALAVDVGLDEPDGLDRGGKWNEDDIVDAFECGQGASAKLVIETWTAGAFIHIFAVSHSDNQQIAQGPGFFEMYDVTGVNPIECAMALNDAFACCSFLFKNSRGVFVSQDFAFFHFAGAARS